MQIDEALKNLKKVIDETFDAVEAVEDAAIEVNTRVLDYGTEWQNRLVREDTGHYRDKVFFCSLSVFCGVALGLFIHSMYLMLK